MLFDRNWRKSHGKELRNYAAYRLPRFPEVFLITRLPWLVVIQVIAAALAVRSKPAVSWWLPCSFSVITMTILVVVYFRERDNELAGYFRYNSAFYCLVSLSLGEFTIAYAIRYAVPYALIVSFLLGLLLLALLLLWLRKRVNDNAFSQDPPKGAGAAGLAGLLGLESYAFCKSVFPRQTVSALTVIVSGTMGAIMLFVGAANWLKAFGADDSA